MEFPVVRRKMKGGKNLTRGLSLKHFVPLGCEGSVKMLFYLPGNQAAGLGDSHFLSPAQ